jgi:hypothetical protein
VDHFFGSDLLATRGTLEEDTRIEYDCYSRKYCNVSRNRAGQRRHLSSLTVSGCIELHSKARFAWAGGRKAPRGGRAAMGFG